MTTRPGAPTLSSAGVKARPSSGLRPTTWEERGVDACAAEHLGFAMAGECVVIAPEAGEGREGGVVALPVHEIGPRDGRLVVVDLVLPQDDELVGVRVRKRSQQDGFDDGEDRGVRADAQGQREKRDGGETGGLGELAEGEPEVGKHGKSDE